MGAHHVDDRWFGCGTVGNCRSCSWKRVRSSYFSSCEFLAVVKPHDEGSAVVEFVLVGALLTFLAVAVLQLSLALHVKNTLQDAASEGARQAALIDSSLSEGIKRTKDLITVAVGKQYARDVTAKHSRWLGAPAVEMIVTAPLPLLGLLGPSHSLEVKGHAAQEWLE